MNALVRSIVQVGIFMVCAQSVVHFRPNGSYEKYVKLLVSIMILIQVFLPVMSFFTGGMDQLMERTDWYRRQLAGGLDQSKELEEEVAEHLEKMTLEELRKRIEESRMAERNDTGEEGREEAFGEDLGEELQKEGSEKEEKRIRIDKIEISLEEEGEDADGEREEMDP